MNKPGSFRQLIRNLRKADEHKTAHRRFMDKLIKHGTCRLVKDENGQHRLQWGFPKCT